MTREAVGSRGALGWNTVPPDDSDRGPAVSRASPPPARVQMDASEAGE